MDAEEPDRTILASPVVDEACREANAGVVASQTEHRHGAVSERVVVKASAGAFERPIIFSGPMVRALLAGRKTQTRRLIKPAPRSELGPTGPMWEHPALAGLFAEHVFGGCVAALVPCPYGRVGDRLWVRETWCQYLGQQRASYRADHPQPWRGTWRSPYHMPRWASRLTLEVTDVRAQRLQEISEEDARAEGFTCLSKDGGRVYKYGIPDSDGWPGTDDVGWPWQDWEADPRRAFARLWEVINSKRAPWAENPWVWAVSFRVVQPARAAGRLADEVRAP